MQLTDVQLDDKYQVTEGRVFLTGIQALARLPMLQRERDRACGLNTAGYISGYRGSPLGGLDTALHHAAPHLAAHDIRFQPGVNEDLAATAIWGTQQLHLIPGAQRDGIFGMWYGKGPGVDRSGDVFKHANFAGTSRHGGVLVVAGDDHSARSSAVAHQSEHVFSACSMPVLAPAGIQDYLDLGLHGWALSRYCGCWVAMKTMSDTAESSATVELGVDRVSIQLPDDFELPPDGLHLRWPDPPLVQERRMQEFKIYAAAAYARANGLNRLVWDSPRPRLGIIACGKAWLDLRQALDNLGIDAQVAADIGLRLYKVGMVWPLEASGVRQFARGLQEILVIEEKRQIIEYQIKEMLYGWRDDTRPRVVGKFDESGEWPAPPHAWLLPPTGELTPALVARALAARIKPFHDSEKLRAHLALLDQQERASLLARATPVRSPYFCSGCPHNLSTRVPEGSCAMAGVGCHLMAVGMARDNLTISQMGGEGVNWLGMAEHAGTRHVFANMGDGTYFHSGLLAIRAAVAAGVNISYKLLYNDAVAMTGGQPVDGSLTVPQLTRQLAAEGVQRIVVLADDPGKYPSDAGFAPGVKIHPREELDAVQRALREVPGVSALVYDQTCAAEKRRRRRHGGAPAARRRVFINERVCEGCGDCSVKSNCLSVVPVQTAFGTKRAIDQHSCNLDTSCLSGFCPAMVSVEGGSLRRNRPDAQALQADAVLPEPQLPTLDAPYALLIAGVGGTGVVTIGAVLGMAAHLEGRGVTVLDMTGMSQKGGAVLSHVRIARDQDALHAVRIDAGGADALIGGEMVVSASADVVSKLRHGHSQAVVNTAQVISGSFILQNGMLAPASSARALLQQALGSDSACFLDATHLATRLLGDSICTNMLLLGVAWQRGCVPLSHAALMRAIELNGVSIADNQLAFAWGRRAACDPEGIARLLAQSQGADLVQQADVGVDAIIARRSAWLVDYQDERLAGRYTGLLTQVAEAEQRAAPGSTRLTEAVARNAFRMLAVKDVYEVARLYTDGTFTQALQAQFDGNYRLHLHFARPWFNPPDPVSGEPRKQAYPGWLMPALKLLARLRWTRGTALDLFNHGAEHRLDKSLWIDYRKTVIDLTQDLRAEDLDLACRIAELPEQIRGFGPVRQRNADAALARLRELKREWTGRRQAQAQTKAKGELQAA